MPIPSINNLLSTLFSYLGTFGMGALLAVVLQHWLAAKHENEIKKREATLLVSELLSKWIKTQYTGKCSNESRWELQSLYWKTILRLDKSILDVLLPRLANTGDAITNNEIIVKCRQLLLGLKNPDIKASELNTWLPLKKHQQNKK